MKDYLSAVYWWLRDIDWFDSVPLMLIWLPPAIVLFMVYVVALTIGIVWLGAAIWEVL
jgi:hypothetical protein